MLYHIKKLLGVGQVLVEPNGDAEFRIRDTEKIVQHIIPIFDKYPLLTSKYYNYYLFRQAALILSNKSISISERNYSLKNLKNKE